MMPKFKPKQEQKRNAKSSEFLGISLGARGPKIHHALEMWAAKVNTSKSSLVSQILTHALSEAGYKVPKR